MKRKRVVSTNDAAITMGFIKICCLLLFCPLLPGYVYAQDFSNRGKDFWLGYGSHVEMYVDNTGGVKADGGSQDLILYFTSEFNTTVTVSIPGLGWTRNYTVRANQITESDPIPKSGAEDARLAVEGVSAKGIHVTSDKPIVAYAHIYNQNVSGASLLFPTPTLGQDYYVLGFTQRANARYAYPFCFVVATEDNTTVEVTPSVSTQTHAAGVPFTQKLMQGEVLNLLGILTRTEARYSAGVDLTGTRIRSVSSNGSGCTKIAVFCGSGKLNITCDEGTPTGNGNGANDGNSADNTIQQIVPLTAWGKKYITTPTVNLPNNFFRVLVKDPATAVTVNGTRLTGLTNNSYYEFQSSAAGVIESDMPVTVAQFITTTGRCSNTGAGNSGDPEMIYLSPVEQTISKVTLNSTSHFNITTHFINVVLRNGGVASFKLDGNAVASSFRSLPQDPAFSYAQLSVSAGVHQLQSDSGFNAIAYGYGRVESYGYNAGTNISDLYQYISIKKEYSVTNLPATCEKEAFRLSLTLPYVPLSIRWDFNNNTVLTPNAPVNIASPVPDSSFIKNDRRLYVFNLPGQYSFSTIGSYPVKVTVNNPTPDGCSGLQEIDYDIQVYPQPAVDWKSRNTGCFTDSAYFEAVPVADGRAIIKYSWNFGNSKIDSVATPAVKYAAAGTYPVSLGIVTDIGCRASVTKNMVLDTPPVVAFVNSDTTCMTKQVSFSDRSTVAAGGTMMRWFWDDGNGKKDTLFSAAAPFRTVYNTSGTYQPSLQVQTANGCNSLRETKSVTIGAPPLVNFGMPKICINDAGAKFTDSTIAQNNESLGFHWRFGDPAAGPLNPDTSLLRNPTHRYSAAASYQVTETVTSAYYCRASLTKTFVVNGALPRAAFAIKNENQLCSNNAVELQNLSSVDFGSVTKLLLYWNLTEQPATADTDHLVYNGKWYSRKYPSAAAKTTMTVAVRAYSGETCMDEVSKVIQLNGSPSVSFGALSSVCEGDANFQIAAASESSGLAGSFSYSGTGVNTTGMVASSTLRAGVYNVKALYVTNEGCRDSVIQPLRVWAYPSLNRMPAMSVLEGESAIIRPVYKASKPRFQWTPGTFLNNTTVPTPEVTPIDEQLYTLTVTDTGGCAVSETILVKVLKKLYLPNVFSPNGDGIHDTWKIPYIEQYPSATIDIFNRYGQKVFTSTGYIQEWNGANANGPLPSGTYYYVVKPGMGRGTMTGSVTIIR